jgi:hypothetical protein
MLLVKSQNHALRLDNFGGCAMNDSQVVSAVRKMWKNERAFLPVSALLAVAISIVVGWYRLDQGPNAFLAGLLVGGLVACAAAVFVYVVRLGTALRGDRPSGLLADHRKLALGD